MVFLFSETVHQDLKSYRPTPIIDHTPSGCGSHVFVGERCLNSPNKPHQNPFSEKLGQKKERQHATLAHRRPTHTEAHKHMHSQKRIFDK